MKQLCKRGIGNSDDQECASARNARLDRMYKTRGSGTNFSHSNCSICGELDEECLLFVFCSTICMCMCLCV